MTYSVTVDSLERLQELAPGLRLTKTEFARLCAEYPDLRIEREPDGHLTIMPPTHFRTGQRNAAITICLGEWAMRDATGVVVDSSTGFDLPDGSNRSPDAAWVLKSRLAQLPEGAQDDYLPLCPDFVIELRSKSDRPGQLEEKMQEYIDNGARLGWLIDPIQRSVTIYRPGMAAVRLNDPESVPGDPELPGFTLPIARIW